MLMTFAVIVYSLLMLMETGVLEKIIAGEVLGMKIGPEVLFVAALERWFPLVMAFLSLTLKDSINRRANIIAGAVYTVLGVVSLAESPSGHSILLWGSATVATALIVWYAWKSKKKA